LYISHGLYQSSDLGYVGYSDLFMDIVDTIKFVLYNAIDHDLDRDVETKTTSLDKNNFIRQIAFFQCYFVFKC